MAARRAGAVPRRAADGAGVASRWTRGPTTVAAALVERTRTPGRVVGCGSEAVSLGRLPRLDAAEYVDGGDLPDTGEEEVWSTTSRRAWRRLDREPRRRRWNRSRRRHAGVEGCRVHRRVWLDEMMRGYSAGSAFDRGVKPG
ncbi:proline-rich receptor-like protein kinase PERK9 [Iris pallida]|uniref:Proline-rich receptor-like protein kinase PERK9 n=1 Tax=Iris pallida TaxID=29817 RepID=A0AAX6HCA9_IRIPA|nr:proline-rich receptor-like protein kinase PERK9 [Iris pallida]